VEERAGSVKYYFDDEIKDMGWAGNVEGMGREQCVQYLFGKSEERYYLEDIFVDGRLIWKWILSK